MRPTRVLGLAGLSIAMLGASANAEIDSEFSLGYANEYIFRGIEFGDDLYEFSFDFSGTGYCDFDWNAGIWYGMYEANYVGDDFTVNEEEVDLYLGISKEFSFGTIGFGAIRYIFPEYDEFDTLELYLSYGYSFNAIDLGAAFYLTVDDQTSSDFESGDWYGELTANYNFQLTETLTGELGVGVGFFDTSWGDGLATYTAHLALSQEISENITLTPYVSLTSNDSDYDEGFSSWNYDGQDNLNFGTRLTFGF